MSHTLKRISSRKSSSSTSKTRKRTNLVLEQKARKFHGLYSEMVQEHEFPCEVAFNVILLLMRRRDAYLFERYNKSSLPGLNKMIGHIESMKTPAGKPRFQFIYLKARFNDTKTQKITKEEYLADHPKYDLILFRTGDRKTQQVLDQDTFSVEFGRLLKLVPFTLNSKPTPGGRRIGLTSVPGDWANNPVSTVCATDLTEFYKNKMYQRGQPHGGQIRYYIDCAGRKSYFLIQMCPAVASPETQKLLADDISQYQAIGRGLGIQTIGWHSPKMGKITHGLFRLGIKFWKLFGKKEK